ncbi:Crp/Fnr family transcriptional regulator [Algoriphagus sp. NBT04N3]|uniref:Crp/Fnr family transcriptional regulator n=1 Tax=Algoriphagus sp. NBT04N3 TaxID=2705473 RepID=UPI001C63793B|nr:Crp/Fnr family transcriptional regulator [Algoriphagus sp. NBT04N3]QYH37530.1 Crp/Fnr family transcriptional regulator [Algoriphagus sp. NBT04N3]
MKKITVKKGTILQRKGDTNSKVYFVESGLLRSYTIDEKGKEHIYMFGPENWLVTDNCKPETPCQLFIDAIEDSVLNVASKEEMLKETPDFNALFRRLNSMQNRIVMLMSSSAKERYEHFVETYPNIIPREPLKMVASYLGITPEALSRVRNELSKKK